MQPFSVASLTATCNSVGGRSLSAAVEVDDVVQTLSENDPQRAQLSKLSVLFRRINSHVAALQELLPNCDVFAATLQEDLPRLLRQGESTLAVMDKQLRRLRAIGAHQEVDSSVLLGYAEALQLQDRLYEWYGPILAE